jgi:DNA-directed RNA polymerase I, II, and III subunit RPABC2
MTVQDSSARVTRPVLTRYERASVIGTRMEQLQHGARPFVDVDGIRDVRAIALRELQERKLPFIIARKLPDGRKELWPLRELLD